MHDLALALLMGFDACLVMQDLRYLIYVWVVLDKMWVDEMSNMCPYEPSMLRRATVRKAANSIGPEDSELQ